MSNTRKRTFTGESIGSSDASSLHVKVPQSLQFKDGSFDKTYSSKYETEWDSEMNEMLEAAIDKIPIVYSKIVHQLPKLHGWIIPC